MVAPRKSVKSEKGGYHEYTGTKRNARRRTEKAVITEEQERECHVRCFTSTANPVGKKWLLPKQSSL